MFGIKFMKVPPTTYIFHYKNGAVTREGAGLWFFYHGPTSTIVSVPLASKDIPFVFNESTADFQAVTIQGQLTYRVTDPRRLAQVFDLSVDSAGAYVTDDLDKLSLRLVQAAQVLAKGFTGGRPLREVLAGSEALAQEVLAALRKSEAVTSVGVEVLALSVLSLKPTPEMAKALEAEAREGLQRRADEAIYARRNAAVEQERRIKESELNTEIAVETKKRQIRETQMAADIAVEEARAKLIDKRVENEKKDTDSKVYALTKTLEPIKELDVRALQILAGHGGDARGAIAMAFQDLAQGAQKIGQLNITPDLLSNLMQAPPTKK